MIVLRAPSRHELAWASALCLRSKASHGYDDAFMRQCEAELTLRDSDLDRDKLVLATEQAQLLGVAQVSHAGTVCRLEKIFVEPAHMGRGIGRRLFDWAVGVAREQGAATLIVEADPNAVPFYQAMGCVAAGRAPSGSIPGRWLPRLTHDLSLSESKSRE